MTGEPKSGRTEKAQQSKLEAILDSAVDAIITINSEAVIETVNPAAEQLFQYDRDEFLGRNVKLLMPEPYSTEHDEYVKQYQETGRPKIIGIGREVVGRRKDGSTFPMHLSVSEFEVNGRSHFAGIVHDLSERKATERALQQSQKMEAIGQLTGGVAHDFNNLLTVIVGNLELLDMKIDDPDDRLLVQDALEAADLGARLTERLLAFARRSHLEPQAVNLNDLVLSLTDMLHRTLGETITLSNALGAGLWQVLADPSQVESALINLAVNARDAMQGDGTMVIETRNAVFDGSYAAADVDIDPGDYVQLSVTDTGSGMTQEIQERVFEPFFTTKEAGRGTGLGLSMVYGFAKQSGGHATVYSEVGKGTTINLYLPRFEADTTLHAKLASRDEPSRGNSELVLVVEDDDRVRRLTMTRLSELGYRVIEAANGPEALKTLQHGSRVDLVFSDIVMPGGMSGYELCEEIRKTNPGIKVLLTSGYAEDVVHPDRLTSENLQMLRKPYRLSELARMIRATIEGN